MGGTDNLDVFALTAGYKLGRASPWPACLSSTITI
jgi:hypothetical protein